MLMGVLEDLLGTFTTLASQKLQTIRRMKMKMVMTPISIGYTIK